MRGFKFRAWDKINKQMCQVLRLEYWDPEPGGDLILGGCYLLPDVRAYRKIEELELMQYTGRKDKNDKEVYQGDIVRYYCPPECNLSGFESTETISWGEEVAGFALGCISHQLTIYDDIEVLGNIYENSDLLKKRLQDNSDQSAQPPQQEQSKSNPRNAQFAGFADLICRSLAEKGILKWNEPWDEAKQIIACGAYDLAVHVLDSQHEIRASASSAEERLYCRITDMPELSKEQGHE